MRSLVTSALMMATLSSGFAAASAQGTDLSGTWLTEDGRAKIRMEKCAINHAQMCGTVVWLKPGQPQTDAKNPDPTKRARPMLGLMLMDGLKLDDGKFKGEIYNSDEGKNYKVSLKRESASELSISGCLLAILCGSQTWTKTTDEATIPTPSAAPAMAAARPAPRPVVSPKTTGSAATGAAAPAAAPAQQ
jgi:uncharacterized protein (DUF2147 family)